MGGLNPAQLSQMIAALPPAQRANLARATGMTPEQFEQMSRMIGSWPPEQLEQMMQPWAAAAAAWAAWAA